MNWTLGVSSCLFSPSLTFLAWSALLGWLLLSVWLLFSFTITGLLLGLLFFHFSLVNSAGALFSVTVAPTGACCQCITRANSTLTLVSALQSRQSCKVLGFTVFWAFWDWSGCLVLFLRLLECFGALFDWLWPPSFGCLPVSIDFTF